MSDYAKVKGLKPCPFCGGDRFETRDTNSPPAGSQSGEIRCVCGAELLGDYGERLSSVKGKWNKRALSSPSPALRVAEEALEAGGLGALRYVLNFADSNARVSTVMKTFTLPDRVTTKDRLERLYTALATLSADQGDAR